MLPSIFGENLFDEWFDFHAFPEFRNIDKKLYGRHPSREMKTDVHEYDDYYEVDIDLPGFKKDELTLRLENGYLTVAAAKSLDSEQTKKGRVVRQERYSGSLQRSFYVGENLTEEDIGAKYADGVLSLTIPKKEQPKLPERKTIMIEG